MKKDNVMLNKIKTFKEKILNDVFNSSVWVKEKKVSFFSQAENKIWLFTTVLGFGTVLATSLLSSAPMLIFNVIMGSLTGFFIGNISHFNRENKKTMKKLKNGEFDDIINVIDELAKDKGEYTLSDKMNSEIIRLSNAMFNYDYTKNDLDKFYGEINVELTEEELNVVLNSDILVGLQKNNVQIGSAIYIYCFLVEAEKVLKLREEKTENMKIAQNYIKNAKTENSTKNDHFDDLVGLKKKLNEKITENV